MTADVNGTLTGHVLADFIHDLRDRQFKFTLVGITAAGINQLFVLAKNFTGFWFNVHGVNGSMPTVEYRSRCLFDGENMPRKRLEGRALKGECRAHNSDSAWQEQKNRPSRARPDAGY